MTSMFDGKVAHAALVFVLSCLLLFLLFTSVIPFCSLPACYLHSFLVNDDEPDHNSLPWSNFEVDSPQYPRLVSHCRRLYESDRFLRAMGYNESAGKVVIFDSIETGFNDFEVGSVSMFILSLAMNRRFFMYCPANKYINMIDEDSRPVFKQTFNWTDPRSSHIASCEQRREDECHRTSFQDIAPEQVFSILLSLMDEKRDIMARGNRGSVAVLFANHPNRITSILQDELGLTADTAYGCIANAIYQTEPRIFNGVLDKRSILIQDTHVKFGLQIRIGDDSIGKRPEDFDAGTKETMNARLFEFVTCALSVYNNISINKPLLMFLISDNTWIKHVFAKNVTDWPFFKQLSIQDQQTLQQSIPMTILGSINHSSRGYSGSLIAIDSKFFSYTDYYMTSGPSGFGKTAAMHATHSNYSGRLYTDTVRDPQKLYWEFMKRPCSSRTVLEIGQEWSQLM